MMTATEAFDYRKRTVLLQSMIPFVRAILRVRLKSPIRKWITLNSPEENQLG